MADEFATPATIENAPTGLASLKMMQKFQDKTFDKVATASSFLPRLQLFSANSMEVQEDKIRAGRYGIVTMKGQPVVDLTDTVEVLLCVWRPKALDMSGDQVISCFNVEDPLFSEIASKAGEQDSGCMYGPEFLVWVPSVEKFTTFFCGSKTARRESVNIKTLCGDKAILKSHLIKKGKYAWHGPQVLECNVPFTMPSDDDLNEQVQTFNNPPDRTAEAVEEPTTGTGRER